MFTKNATEALNLVANSWGRANLRRGDVVVLTEMEHHANLVPWLMLAESIGLELRYLPIDGDGRLDLADLDRLLEGAKVAGHHRDVQRARHDQPGAHASPRRPIGPERWSSSTAPSRCPTWSPT